MTPTPPTLPDLIATLKQRGIDLSGTEVRTGSYGDTEASSDRLIALMAAGVKRATCSLLWSWECEGERLPRQGDTEIVLNARNQPVLLLRTTSVEIVPFDRVSEEFAAAEGEGDLSLASWRAEHWRFFDDACRRMAWQARPSMPLVCETFDLLARLA